MGKEIMHFGSFQEMLDFINHKDHAEELKEYVEPKKEEVVEDVRQDD